LIMEKSNLVSAWRGVSRFDPPQWLGADLLAKVQQRKQEELDTQRKAVDALDAKIHEAVQPKPHVFAITLAG
jgi:hypothetical protein